jgi:protein-disulfide isomerase-like protein with CxxC motif
MTALTRGGAVSTVQAVEYTDPMCSWAWGTEPKYRRLRWQYGDQVDLRQVVVGIFSPGWEAMFLTEEGKAHPAASIYYRPADYFAVVTETTGAPYASPHHRPPLNSEDPCRFAVAARAQGPEVAERVVRRLRESMFIHGRPADTVERALAALDGVPGLDVAQWGKDIADPETEAAWQADWAAARRPNEYVCNREDKRPGMGAAQTQNGQLRYGLPCVVLTGPAGEATVAGWCGWADWAAGLEAVAPGITATARPLPTPAEALAVWPTLTRAEVDELCGPDATPPPGAVVHTWPGGEVWVSAREADTGLWVAL